MSLWRRQQFFRLIVKYTYYLIIYISTIIFLPIPLNFGSFSLKSYSLLFKKITKTLKLLTQIILTQFWHMWKVIGWGTQTNAAAAAHPYTCNKTWYTFRGVECHGNFERQAVRLWNDNSYAMRNDKLAYHRKE